MKKIILTAVLFFSFCSIYSNHLIGKSQKFILEYTTLKKLTQQPLEYSTETRIICLKNDTLLLNKPPDTTLEKLESEIKTIKVVIENLDKELPKRKNKLREDSLKIIDNNIIWQKEIDSLMTKINELNETIKDKDKTIVQEKEKNKNDIIAAKEEGKKETLKNIIESYKDNSFDDLINKSTQLSIQNDLDIIDNNAEIKPILLDLEKYFNAKELLSKKYDFNEIENAQKQLNEIEKNSELVNKLKKEVKYYKIFDDNLTTTIEKIKNLDKEEDVLIQLSDYMYNFYNYVNYPYLRKSVYEEIKRSKKD